MQAASSADINWDSSMSENGNALKYNTLGWRNERTKNKQMLLWGFFNFIRGQISTN